MAKTTEIKNRIDTVESIGSITNAMYLVAMAKLQKHQKRIETIKKYDGLVQEHIVEIIAAMEYVDETTVNPLLRFDSDKKSDKVAYIVYSSDLGLCGAYNTNVVKYLKDEIEGKNPDDLFVYMVGKMGANRAKHEGIPIFKSLETDADILTYNEIRDEIVVDLIERYCAREFDTVKIIYTRYKNPLVQELETKQILPLTPYNYEKDGSGTTPPYVLFEPSRNDVLEYLITKNIKTQAYIYYLEAQTSEEAVRRSSMDNANRNGEELIEKLKLAYNRERQSAITQEIAEIIGGSEIL